MSTEQTAAAPVAARALAADDMADLARGAAILGSGGGGNPYMGQLIAERALTDHGDAQLVDVESVPAEAVILPLAVMGAPTVFQERLLAGDEVHRAITRAGIEAGRSVTHLMAVEVGGVNATTPIAPAVEMGLPLVDADLMGRAFPELPMVLTTLAGRTLSPVVLADDKGNVVTIEAVDSDWSERIARVVAVAMGGTAVIALPVIAGADLGCVAVRGTLTLAQQVGATVRRSREEHRDPIESLCTKLGATRLFHGRVLDVDRELTGGFVQGHAVIEGVPNHRRKEAGHSQTDKLVVDFQNEYLLARQAGAPVATTPNLICVLETETGEPVPADVLRYGLRVTVIVAHCDPRWTSAEGLALVGPQHFGYDCTFSPLTNH
ncbi:DUF917 domain-containing protein [Streptomyces sp. NBC_01116]|uniref:DUF917 domain-containing protein n=1 Tax=Streptomyces sp. NBC_01116 TaxID=2903752 RepID=UPI00325657AA